MFRTMAVCSRHAQWTRKSPEAMVLKDIHQKLVSGLRLVRGVTHAEFLKAHCRQPFLFY